MKPLGKMFFTAGVAAAATALCAVPANAAAPHSSHRDGASGTSGPVFVQNDANSGNAVIAYDRTPTGGLTQVGAYPTGGLGGTVPGSIEDHLATEYSLTYDSSANLLYAVNAGSDTITTFAVHGDRLDRRQIVPSFGQFPASVAHYGNQVYVLNTADGGSISGYLQTAGYLIPIPAWHRELNLPVADPAQANDASTPGGIAFTPDGHSLVITTKNAGNSIETFSVGQFGPSRQPVVTALPGTVPFGFDFDSYHHLAAAEPGVGSAATFTVNRDGSVTPLDADVTGGAAPCWVTSNGSTLYVSNADSNTLSVYRSDASGQLTLEQTLTTDPGTEDAALSGDGQFLYVQTGINGIVDAFRVNDDGTLTPTGSAPVPNGKSGEGIVAL